MRLPLAVGDRTYVRHPVEADSTEFVECARRSREHLQPFVYAAEDGAAFTLWLQRGNLPDAAQYLVCRRDDDALVGFVTLNQLVRGSLEQATAGWACFVPHTGQGLLTEGLRLCLDLAFGSLRLHRVEANIQPDNARSRALALRCGFHLEGYSPSFQRVGGQWQDHERWAASTPDRGSVPTASANARS